MPRRSLPRGTRLCHAALLMSSGLPMQLLITGFLLTFQRKASESASILAPKRDITPLIRSCGSCPDGAASLVCHFSHALPTFQHFLSPVPVVNGLIGTGEETSLKRDTASPELPIGAFATPYTGLCQREVGLATGWADCGTDATGLAVVRSCCHRSASSKDYGPRLLRYQMALQKGRQRV